MCGRGCGRIAANEFVRKIDCTSNHSRTVWVQEQEGCLSRTLLHPRPNLSASTASSSVEVIVHVSPVTRIGWVRVHDRSPYNVGPFLDCAPGARLRVGTRMGRMIGVRVAKLFLGRFFRGASRQTARVGDATLQPLCSFVRAAPV